MSTAIEKAIEYNGQNVGGPSSVLVSVDGGKRGQRGTYFLLSNGDPNVSSPTYPYPKESFINHQYGDNYNPLDALIFATPQRYDVCINLNPYDPGYLDLYYYIDGTDGLKWYNTINLTPTSYPANKEITFIDGISNFSLSAVIPAALSPIVDAGMYSPAATLIIDGGAVATVTWDAVYSGGTPVTTDIDKFNMQYNVISNNPISSIIKLNDTSGLEFDFATSVLTLNLVIVATEYVNDEWVALNGDYVTHLLISFNP